jgi:hypothetical protein
MGERHAAACGELPEDALAPVVKMPREPKKTRQCMGCLLHVLRRITNTCHSRGLAVGLSLGGSFTY